MPKEEKTPALVGSYTRLSGRTEYIFSDEKNRKNSILKIGTDQFEVGKMLGEGGFGIVHELINSSKSESFARKKFKDDMDSDQIELVERECRFWNIVHPEAETRAYIFKQRNTEGKTGNVRLVMPKPTETTLYSILKSTPTLLEQLYILRAAIKELQRIHALGIVHSDFKATNILVWKNQHGQYQAFLIDLGYAGREHDSITHYCSYYSRYEFWQDIIALCKLIENNMSEEHLTSCSVLKKLSTDTQQISSRNYPNLQKFIDACEQHIVLETMAIIFPELNNNKDNGLENIKKNQSLATMFVNLFEKYHNNDGFNQQLKLYLKSISGANALHYFIQIISANDDDKRWYHRLVKNCFDSLFDQLLSHMMSGRFNEIDTIIKQAHKDKVISRATFIGLGLVKSIMTGNNAASETKEEQSLDYTTMQKMLGNYHTEYSASRLRTTQTIQDLNLLVEQASKLNIKNIPRKAVEWIINLSAERKSALRLGAHANCRLDIFSGRIKKTGKESATEKVVFDLSSAYNDTSTKTFTPS